MKIVPNWKLLQKSVEVEDRTERKDMHDYSK